MQLGEKIIEILLKIISNYIESFEAPITTTLNNTLRRFIGNHLPKAEPNSNIIEFKQFLSQNPSSITLGTYNKAFQQLLGNKVFDKIRADKNIEPEKCIVTCYSFINEVASLFIFGKLQNKDFATRVDEELEILSIAKFRLIEYYLNIRSESYTSIGFFFQQTKISESDILHIKNNIGHALNQLSSILPEEYIKRGRFFEFLKDFFSTLNKNFKSDFLKKVLQEISQYYQGEHLLSKKTMSERKSMLEMINIIRNNSSDDRVFSKRMNLLFDKKYARMGENELDQKKSMVKPYNSPKNIPTSPNIGSCLSDYSELGSSFGSITLSDLSESDFTPPPSTMTHMLNAQRTSTSQQSLLPEPLNSPNTHLSCEKRGSVAKIS